MLFVGILFSVNAFGIITSKMIHINQKTIIDHPALNIVPNQLLANFISSTKELLVINGLRFCMNGIKWIPLFCIALFINFIVYKSIYLVIRKKERTPISDIIIFLTMSLMCVYLVGIFIFRVRAIYYFVWYLLVVFCFMYYIDDSRKEKVVWWMIIFSIVNYMCNFTPDYITYCKTNKIYKTINQDLEKQNIKRLYFDWNTAPIIAAYSNDRICAGARGKSGSNDANPEYIAQLRKIFDEAKVAFQTAELGKVDEGGGGTIAYIPAAYSMNVIDCGVAVLSMHAPWEITSKSDIYEVEKGYEAFLKNCR